MPKLTEGLRAARRSICGETGVGVDGGWTWDESISKWCLPFSVFIEGPLSMPATTRWIACTEASYPRGEVSVYPAIDGGIIDTLHHQNCNATNRCGTFARSGKLCLFQEDQAVSIPDEELKLLAYVRKTVEWVRAANTDKLTNNGEFFELPDYPASKPVSVAFIENDVSIMVWKSHPGIRAGTAVAFRINESVIGIGNFSGSDDTCVYSPSWGFHFSKSTKESDCIAMWIVASRAPSVGTWQAPVCYGELLEYFSSCGIDFWDYAKRIFPKLRDGRQHLLLIGFPIPKRYGETASHMHWVAALLPRISTEKDFKGSPGKERHLLTRDKQVLSANKNIEWLPSRNWDRDELLSRGRFDEETIDRRILLVGAGSLGSLLAEQFVRSGACDLTISDNDLFQAGNIVRHVLTLDDVGRNKAKTLAGRLNSLNPEASITAIDELTLDSTTMLGGYDSVIDCTGSSRLLKLFDDAEGNACLITLSFSFGAERLYCSSTTLSDFSINEYQKHFGRILEDDLKKHPPGDFPSEGTGCWSAVFPATASDLMRAASFAADFAEKAMITGEVPHRFVCYMEERDESGFLTSFRAVEYD